MLAITGQPALPSFGKRALQESACTGVNTLGMFRHCTRYDTLVSHVDQVESKLVNALMRASKAPRGPSHLSMPVDILRSPIESMVPSYNLRSLLHRPALVDDALVRSLCQEILQAGRTVILISHRPASLALADRIFRIDAGDAIEIARDTLRRAAGDF